MFESWSRSQGHTTCQKQERNISAVDDHINFKLGALGKINRKWKYGELSAYKMQKSMANVSKSPKFCTL